MSARASDPFDAFAVRLAGCIRMLVSSESGDVTAALAGITRLLRGASVDLHKLADRIETPGGLAEGEKKKIRDAIEQARTEGYAAGVQAAENRLNGAGAFHSTTNAEWARVALYVQREKHRLPVQHHQFVDDMAARTAWDLEPSDRQHRYLHSLFLKLGGKIT
jgi:hypothetical protein